MFCSIFTYVLSRRDSGFSRRISSPHFAAHCWFVIRIVREVTSFLLPRSTEICPVYKHELTPSRILDNRSNIAISALLVQLWALALGTPGPLTLEARPATDLCLSDKGGFRSRMCRGDDLKRLYISLNNKTNIRRSTFNVLCLESSGWWHAHAACRRA